MNWNYRVVRTDDPENGTCYYGIHEAYYENDEPKSITEQGVIVVEDNNDYEGVDRLRSHLTKMLEALDKDILNYEDF